MYVVSWTGDEVEIFRGMDLLIQAVASAFQFQARGTLIQPGRSSITSSLSGPYSNPTGWIAKLAIIALVGLVVGPGLIRSCRSRSVRQAFAPTKPSTPVSPLRGGTSGTIGGKTWRLVGHAVVEVRKPGFIYDRHEYQLADEAGAPARLVCGLDSGGKEWRLLQPVELDVPLTPDLAASKRAGESIGVKGRPMQIKQLYLTTVRSSEGLPPTELRPGEVAYNFLAESGGDILLASWTASGIVSYAGSLVPEKEVLAAFGRSSDAGR
jgi:hypothetical protein